MLVRPAACTAACEFAVNHDGRHAADAVMLRLGRDFGYTGVSVFALASVIIGVFTTASILLFGARRPKREK